MTISPAIARIPLRIAVVTETFPATSETFIRDQVLGLIELGHEVTVLARTHDGSGLVPALAQAPGFHLEHCIGEQEPQWAAGLRLLRRSLRAPRHSLALWRALRRALPARHRMRWLATPFHTPPRRYDAILAQFGPNGLLASHWRAAGEIAGPLFTLFHGYDLTGYLAAAGNEIYAPLFAVGDRFLPCTDFFAQRLREIGCPPDRIVVHRYGVDRRRFSPVARTRSPGAPFHIVSVARFVEKKGLEDAVDAVAQLRGTHSALRYTIIGTGPLLADIETRIAARGLAAHVTLMGRQPSDAVAHTLASADVLLAPSVTARNGDMEGLPVAIIEACTTLLPVVATRHSGIPEILVDGVTGWLADEHAPDQLARLLREVADHPETAAQVAGRARQRVVEDFSHDQQAERLVRLVQGVARSEAASPACAIPPVRPSPSWPERVLMANLFPDWGGGAEASLLGLATALRQQGRHIGLIVTDPNGGVAARFAAAGIEIVAAPADVFAAPSPTDGPWQRWRRQARLCRLVRRFGPDVIHTNDERSPSALVRIAARLNVPMVAHIRDDERDWVPAHLWSASRHIGRFVLPSSAMRTLLRRLAVPDHRCTVVPNGIDLHATAADSIRRDALRADLGVPHGVPVLVVVGALCPRKGQADLLRAAAQMACRPHVWLVGRDWAPGAPDLTQLTDLVRVLRLTDRVRFLGQREDALNLMGAADLVVAPSSFEAFGRTYVEGCGVGRPVVAYDIASARELLQDGACGALVPLGDVPGLAAACDALVADPVRYAASVTAGLARAADFTLARHADRMLLCYRSAQERHS